MIDYPLTSDTQHPHTIAAIGDASSILIFHALGIRTAVAETPPEIEKALHRLAREGCAVIYITEQAAETIPDAIRRYKTQAYPAIIPVPNRSGSTGLGMRSIQENVEKAVGSALF